MTHLVRPALAAVLAASLLLAGWSPAQADDARFSDGQKAEIEAMIRDYILRHPEVVLESLRIMEARQQAAEEQRLKQRLVDLGPALYADPRDPVIGNPDGDVTIVEFFDYQCGYCKSMLEPLVAFTREDGGVRLVMKEFPILGATSMTAAKAALASIEQGKYETFHVALMGLRGKLSEPAIFQTALEVGIDVERLKADMESPAIAAWIRETRALAEALEIRGTPAFAIGDQLIPGAFGPDRLRALVGRARQQG